MPTISRFSGITITMYFDDHEPAHFHARHGGRKAKVRIEPVELIAGRLGRRELRLVLAWAELHRDELLINWQAAHRGERLRAVEPLR